MRSAPLASPSVLQSTGAAILYGSTGEVVPHPDIAGPLADTLEWMSGEFSAHQARHPWSALSLVAGSALGTTVPPLPVLIGAALEPTTTWSSRSLGQIDSQAKKALKSHKRDWPTLVGWLESRALGGFGTASWHFAVAPGSRSAELAMGHVVPTALASAYPGELERIDLGNPFSRGPITLIGVPLAKLDEAKRSASIDFSAAARKKLVLRFADALDDAAIAFLDQANVAMEELTKLQSGQLVRGRSGHLAQLQCVTIST